MRVLTGFLRARIGRRIALLFFACALFPISLFSGLTLWHARAQLADQSREYLSELARESGQSILFRLRLAELELRHAIARGGPTGGDSGVRVFGADAGTGSDAGPVPEIGDDEARARLRAGGTVLLVRDGRVQLVRAVAPGVDGRLAWAELDPDYVRGWLNPWDPAPHSPLPAGLELCVTSAAGPVTPCPEEVLRGATERGGVDGPPGTAIASGPRAANRVERLFEWSEGGARWLAASRSLFLRPSFGSDPWRVVVSQPRSQAFAPAVAFQRTFALAATLSLLLVPFLSQVQIRRNLEPLERLQEGTRRIAARDFDTRVEIESGDEFEELAESFNSMASQIGVLVGELDRLNLETITAFARAIDAKSAWTAGHSERVTEMALRLGRTLGLDASALVTLERGGLLHDIGKIGVPGRILDKPGRLTEEEFALMRAHTTIGAAILQPITPLEEMLPIVRHHHERWDGNGYPDGLAGEEIPWLARIAAVADVFDALRSARPYRGAMPLAEVTRIILGDAGTAFDPAVVEAFREVVDDLDVRETEGTSHDMTEAVTA